MKKMKLKISLHLLWVSMVSQAGVMGEDSSDALWKNFYFGVDGGYALSLNSTDLKPDYASSETNTFGVPDNTTFQHDIGNSGMIGGFLGYRVNENLSFNINYDYRGNFKWEILSVFLTNRSELYQTNNIKIQTIFVNAVLNPNVNWGGLTPYINLGLGASINQIGTIENRNIQVPELYDIFLSGRTLSNFAWNVGLGTDYQITKHLHYTLGYRFVSAGQLISSNYFSDSFNGTSGSITPFKADYIFLNEVLTGFRWQF